MIRQIALDTETTGLDPKEGHRIIEVACVEIIDRRITGSHYHTYINPERAIDSGAIAVHGLSEEFLADKPVFKAVVAEFMAYIKDAELIIHNAPFDLGFLQRELKLSRRPEHLEQSSKITDTLRMARERYPRQKNNLDALCKRLSIDNSQRHYHGALIDAQLLAEVYLAMTAGQNSLFLEKTEIKTQGVNSDEHKDLNQILYIDLPVQLASEQEEKEHETYLKKMQKINQKVIWLEG